MLRATDKLIEIVSVPSYKKCWLAKKEGYEGIPLLEEVWGEWTSSRFRTSHKLVNTYFHQFFLYNWYFV
jgi:hypothetical protein